MPCKVTVLPVYTGKRITERKGLTVVSTVSKSEKAWERNLSPFILGPCKLYDNYVSLNMENGWQYAKVYADYCHPSGTRPMDIYFDWAQEGWCNPKAVRYPMGRGTKPEFSWWNGRSLDYIAARKAIYGPLYAEAVKKTPAWEMLQGIYEDFKELVLLDYDAYDHRALGMSLSDVLNNPHRKMGHAFVLAMMLTKDKALKEMELRS